VLGIKSVIRGLKDIENVYTQHKPQLADLLQQILTKKLSERDYPIVVNSALTPTVTSPTAANRPP
jgi:hypothetical protein